MRSASLNIFLDSNILFADPFFKRNFERHFIQILDEINGKLYISDVVYKETIKNYKREVKRRIKEYTSSLNKLGNILLIKPIDIIGSVDKYTLELEEFFKHLQAKGVLQIIEHSRFNIFSEIVDRAINNKKPFAEGKEEFKDAVIWLTYANFVERMKLTHCFFITNNTKEFFNSDRSDLHKDLLDDTSRIKGYTSIENFMTKEKELINNLQEEAKIEAEIEEAYFNKLLELGASRKVKSRSYIEELLITSFMDEIDEELSNYIDDLTMLQKEKLFQKYSTGQTLPTYKLRLVDHERETYRDEIVIYGLVEVTHDIKLFMIKEDGREEVHIGNKSLTHQIDFTFSLDADEIASRFEVKEIITKELEPELFN